MGEEDTDAPRAREGVCRLGTICQIVRQRKLPDGRVKVLVQGLLKATLEGIVMQESAQAALSYIRSRASDFGVPAEWFESHASM